MAYFFIETRETQATCPSHYSRYRKTTSLGRSPRGVQSLVWLAVNTDMLVCCTGSASATRTDDDADHPRLQRDMRCCSCDVYASLTTRELAGVAHQPSSHSFIRSKCSENVAARKMAVQSAVLMRTNSYYRLRYGRGIF